MKLQTLGKELAEAKGGLERTTIDHEGQLTAVGQAYDALRVAPSEGLDPLSAHMLQIPARVHELERDAPRAGVNRSFTIARSHYVESINLEALSQGYPDVYDEDELREFEDQVTPSRNPWQIG